MSDTENKDGKSWHGARTLVKTGQDYRMLRMNRRKTGKHFILSILSIL